MSSIVSTNAWYDAVARMADRAEDLANPTSTYVDTTFLAALLNRRNQIIFGRRGTGKTHLLRRLRDELLARFSELKIVPVYIDGATLPGSITPYSDPAAVALGLYVELLRRAVGELSSFLNGRLRPGPLDWLFPGARHEAIVHVREAVGQLDRLLAQGRVRILPMGEARAEVDDLDEAVSRRRMAVGANADASLSDPRTLGIRLEASVEKALEKTVRTMTTRRLGGETYLPFAEITELIRRLLATIAGASLAILVDEWSALGNDEVQPLLAQLLRLTARGGICLKLACIPGRTRLFVPAAAKEARNPIGLEVGDDITVDVDLDSVVFVDNDVKQLAGFFMSLLQRHVGASVPEVLRVPFDAFSEYVLTERMTDPRLLAELCHASSAVPRDFINIFRQATILQRSGGHDAMSPADVRSAAYNVYQGKCSNLASTRPDELRLLDRIYRKVVLGQNSYLFLVEASLADNPRIVELFTAKLIHRTSATWLDPSTMLSYVYYMVDYGTSIELLRQAGAKAWDDMVHGTMGGSPVEFFKPDVNPGLLDLILEQLVGSFDVARLDADPGKLIVDLAVIE